MSDRELEEQPQPDLLYTTRKKYALTFSSEPSRTTRKLAWAKNTNDQLKGQMSKEFQNRLDKDDSGQFELGDHGGIRNRNHQPSTFNVTEDAEASEVPVVVPDGGSSEHTQRLTTSAISISTYLANVCFGYPFCRLRRQCQVHSTGKKYHLNPFTLLGVACNIQTAQGCAGLWRGLRSDVWFIGISLSSDFVINEASGGQLPSDFPASFSPSAIGSHLALKTLVAFITAPIYGIHVVESVQSDMVICDSPFLSVIPAAFNRIFHRGQMWSPRLLPYFKKILLPTVSFLLLRYVVSTLLQRSIASLIRWHERNCHERRMTENSRLLALNSHSVPPQPFPTTSMQSSIIATPPPTLAEILYADLMSTFIAELITDAILYPYETTLHRLHIQGTRTIIDNTDAGTGFCSVGSRYEGFFECFSSIRDSEGNAGLYRGFGALVIQHCVKYATVRTVQFVLGLNFY